VLTGFLLPRVWLSSLCRKPGARQPYALLPKGIQNIAEIVERIAEIRLDRESQRSGNGPEAGFQPSQCLASLTRPIPLWSTEKRVIVGVFRMLPLEFVRIGCADSRDGDLVRFSG